MSTIHIILHGLIALAPTTAAGVTNPANHMTALLVDARRQPPEYEECFAPHQPMLKVKTSTPSECLDAGCTHDGSDCVCVLLRQEISLQAELKPEKASITTKLDTQPVSGLPFDIKSADNFSYLANLSQLGQKFDERFLAAHPPIALIARMTFPFEQVSACALGTRRDEGFDNVHPMGFRPLSTNEQVGDASQALAQGVVAMFETGQDPLAITLTDFESGSTHKLTLAPINGAYDIQLMNERFDDHSMSFIDALPDSVCDDGVARDFAFFYELVKSPPSWADRKIPHVKFTRWKGSKDLLTLACEAAKFKAADSHPICAMAAFIP